MPEKEITKKLTKLIKDLDKLAQVAQQAIKDLKAITKEKENGENK